MHRPNEVYLSDIPTEGLGFWSSGNSPTQAAFCLSLKEALLHFKCLYLLSDRVIAAASFYFESAITRDVAARMRSIFRDGDAVFFVDESVEGFSEHGLVKMEKSPRGLIAYRDKRTVLATASELNQFGFVLKRPDISISDRIVELWAADLESTRVSSLGWALRKCVLEPSTHHRVKEAMVRFALMRQKDFVWEYLLPLLRKLGLPKGFRTLCRRKLAQMYCLATSELIGALPDRTAYAFAPESLPSPKFDTALFLECIEYLRLNGAIQRLRTPELITLKKSDEFREFRTFYFMLVDAVAYQAGRLIEAIKYCCRAESLYPDSGSTCDRFLASFKSLFDTLPLPCMKTCRPLEYLLRMFDACNKRVVKDFVVLANMLSGHRLQGQILSETRVSGMLSEPVAANLDKETAMPVGRTAPRKTYAPDLVFISYSRRDRRWLERLRVHLKPQERAGVIEAWDDGRCQPGTKWKDEITKALKAAKIAVLLISPDFLASDFISKNELPPILEAAENEGLLILSIIVSPCRFKQTPILSDFQAVNAPDHPLTVMNEAEQEQVFVNVTEAIDRVQKP